MLFFICGVKLLKTDNVQVWIIGKRWKQSPVGWFLESLQKTWSLNSLSDWLCDYMGITLPGSLCCAKALGNPILSDQFPPTLSIGFQSALTLPFLLKFALSLNVPCLCSSFSFVDVLLISFMWSSQKRSLNVTKQLVPISDKNNKKLEETQEFCYKLVLLTSATATTTPNWN